VRCSSCECSLIIHQRMTPVRLGLWFMSFVCAQLFKEDWKCFFLLILSFCLNCRNLKLLSVFFYWIKWILCWVVIYSKVTTHIKPRCYILAAAYHLRTEKYWKSQAAGGIWTTIGLHRNVCLCGFLDASDCKQANISRTQTQNASNIFWIVIEVPFVALSQEAFLLNA